MKAARRAPAQWDRHAIMAEVRRRGSNLRQVALAAGLSESTCRQALRVSIPAGEAAIAEFLNVTVQELWPSRYPTLPAPRRENDTNGAREASLNDATDQTPVSNAVIPPADARPPSP